MASHDIVFTPEARDQLDGLHAYISTATGSEIASGFVDGIIDDFVDHVMETGAVIRVADIHAGALANGVETPQNLDRFGAVVIGSGCFRRRRRFSHIYLELSCTDPWPHGADDERAWATACRNTLGRLA